MVCSWKTSFCVIQKSINRINKTELKQKWGESRLNVRKYFLVVRASLCKADRQGDVGCRVRLSPLPSGDCHCGGFKNKAELSINKYAAGNNPVLDRYGQDQLTDLFTVGKKTLLKKSLNLPPHSAFSFKRTDYITLQAHV